MADRIYTRRSFLGKASSGAAAALVQTITVRSRAAEGSQQRQAEYKPAYFTSSEWVFVNAAVGRLIPDGGNGPGGVEVGVPEFIDRQMDTSYGYGGYWYMQGPFVTNASPSLGYQLKYTPRDLYRQGIAGCDVACHHSYGAGFVSLRSEQQDEFLTKLEKGEITIDGPPAGVFFHQLLTNTREGYFADPLYGGNRGMASWKFIGFPGARADFTDWMDQQGKSYPYGPVSIHGSKDG